MWLLQIYNDSTSVLYGVAITEEQSNYESRLLYSAKINRHLVLLVIMKIFPQECWIRPTHESLLF